MEADDERLRGLFAENMAQSFLLEILLVRYLSAEPAERWDALANGLILMAGNFDEYAGLAKDEQAAEWFSDVAVQMQMATQAIVRRAVLRLKAGRKAGEAEGPEFLP